MSISLFTSLKTIFISEFILFFAMVTGTAPQEFSYLILLLLAISFIKLNELDALKLFIISVPLFVALPENQFSDSMSVWRILILILFLKMIYEKYSEYLFYSYKTLENYHPKLVSGSANNKSLSHFQFIRQEIKRIVKDSSNIQKILKQVQNDKINKLFLLTALFFIITLLSLFFAQNVGAGIKKILFLLNIFLLFPFVIFSVKSKNDFLEILRFIFYSAGLIVFVGYLQFILTFFVPLFSFWQFWTQNIIRVLYGQNLSDLLSYSNTWFSYYEVLPPTLRMFSFMPDSHSFAMFIIISIPTVLALIFYYSNREKKHFFLALIFFLLAIFFSGSRGAWVGSVFALGAAVYLFVNSQNAEFKNLCKLNLQANPFSFPLFNWFWKKVRGKNMFKQIAFLKNFNNPSDNYFSKIIISSILLFFVLMPISSFILRVNQEIQLYRSNIQLSDKDKEKLFIFERVLSISDLSETSNMGRLQIWKETLTSISKKPFLGVGFGNFPTVLKESVLTSKMGSSAHSTYLDIASEIGVLGLIIFLLILKEILITARDLFFESKEKFLKIFAGSFFVYFIWVFGYGIFDVVIFNDKVLIIAVIMIGLLYSTKYLHNLKKMQE